MGEGSLESILLFSQILYGLLQPAGGSLAFLRRLDLPQVIGFPTGQLPNSLLEFLFLKLIVRDVSGELPFLSLGIAEPAL
jgi:hypothetical protein